MELYQLSYEYDYEVLDKKGDRESWDIEEVVDLHIWVSLEHLYETIGIDAKRRMVKKANRIEWSCRLLAVRLTELKMLSTELVMTNIDFT